MSLTTLPALAANTNAPRFYLDEEHHHDDGTLLGFWIFLMSDCLIFAVLFAAYAVLGRNFAGGPTGAGLFDLPMLALNTAALLLSSITFGMAMTASLRNRLAETLAWLAATGILGALFLSLELTEFVHLASRNAGPWRSAFLSSFFTVVATHGLHVAAGVIWLGTLAVHLFRRGFSEINRRRLMCLSLFWHFLDVIWVGVFSFVYLLGVL